MKLRARARTTVGLVGVVTLVLIAGALPAAATPPTTLFFSEYIEGSSNNKALEIYNGTGEGTIQNDDIDCAAAFTPISEIQGAGATTPIPGTVTTKGVVVGDYESSGSLRGFYLQSHVPDANPGTSEGVFVFNGLNDSVSVGDVVYVTGTAEEFQDQTQIGNVTSVYTCGTDTVTPVDVTFPVASPTFLEQYEGMLVRMPQAMFVSEHFQLGRFGQVTLSSGGRLQQPTNVVAPGAPALALQAQNNLNRVVLDDASQLQNPDPIVFGRGGLPLSAANTLRGGDTAADIVGVMTYTWAGNGASGNAYRVRPVNAMGGTALFMPTNPRPASAPAVGGTLRVVGMNLLNFFNTFTRMHRRSGRRPTGLPRCEQRRRVRPAVAEDGRRDPRDEP